MEQSRQGHDNKLADGCRENKGHRRLDIIAIPISQNLSAARGVWTALKGLKGCFDPHTLTPMILRSHDASLLTQRLAECKDEQISQEELSEKLNVS